MHSRKRPIPLAAAPQDALGATVRPALDGARHAPAMPRVSCDRFECLADGQAFAGRTPWHESWHAASTGWSSVSAASPSMERLMYGRPGSYMPAITRKETMCRTASRPTSSASADRVGTTRPCIAPGGIAAGRAVGACLDRIAPGGNRRTGPTRIGHEIGGVKSGRHGNFTQSDCPCGPRGSCAVVVDRCGDAIRTRRDVHRHGRPP